jgi:hypothetical protein
LKVESGEWRVSAEQLSAKLPRQSQSTGEESQLLENMILLGGGDVSTAAGMTFFQRLRYSDFAPRTDDMAGFGYDVLSLKGDGVCMGYSI